MLNPKFTAIISSIKGVSSDDVIKHVLFKTGVLESKVELSKEKEGLIDLLLFSDKGLKIPMFVDSLYATNIPPVIGEEVGVSGVVSNSKSKNPFKYTETELKEFRNLFRGIRPRSMGAKASVKKKIERLLSGSPHTMEDVLKATRSYLKECERSGTFKQSCDNFIWKGDLTNSTLQHYLDEIEEGPEEDHFRKHNYD